MSIINSQISAHFIIKSMPAGIISSKLKNYILDNQFSRQFGNFKIITDRLKEKKTVTAPISA